MVRGEVDVILQPNADRTQFDQFIKTHNLTVHADDEAIHMVALEVPAGQEKIYVNLIDKIPGVQYASLDYFIPLTN